MRCGGRHKKALYGHGVKRAVVSCGHLPDQIAATFGERYGDLALEYAVEPTPLGTGGGIAFAARGLEGSFFALNGDSLREADLTELVRLHRSSGAKATILLTPVADPSRYGLVRLADDGRVESFLEKPRPEEIDTDLINAGLYVLEPDVLDLVAPGKAVGRFGRVHGLPPTALAFASASDTRRQAVTYSIEVRNVSSRG